MEQRHSVLLLELLTTAQLPQMIPASAGILQFNG
jgi:hypothetical protein